MKRCLLGISLLLTFRAGAQEAGLRANATLRLNALGVIYPQRSWSYSAGAWYEQRVGKRLGVAAGLSYLQYGRVPSKAINNFGALYQTLHLAEVPVLLTLRPGKVRPAGWHWRLLAGYSLGKVLAAREYLFGFNDTYVEHSRSGASFAAYHFINAGAELRRRWQGGLITSIGLMARSGSRRQQGEGRYEVRDLSLVLSAGYDFSSRTAARE